MADENTDETVSVEDELGSIFDEAQADDAPADATPAEDSPPSEGAPADPIQEADTSEDKALDAPASWSADAKAIWPSLDPVAQQELLRRESDWQKADGERAERLKALEPYEQALAPVLPTLQLNGVQPAQYIGQLAAADRYLRENPQEAFQWLAQQYGYDLSQLHQEQQEIDPALQPLVGELNQIKQQFTGFMTQQQQREQAQAEAVVTQFMDNPENAYAKRLEAEIFAEIPVVKANNPAASHQDVLRMAYDRAVRLNDEVQSEIVAAKAKEAEEARKAKAAKEAAEAKRISESNLSTTGTSSGDTPTPMDTEDELGQIFDRMQGAA